MIFVSIWFSFAVSLLILNLQRKRITYDSIPNFNWWKALVLFGTGFFGGLSFTLCDINVSKFFRAFECFYRLRSWYLLFLYFNSILPCYWKGCHSNFGYFNVSFKRYYRIKNIEILRCLNTWVGFYWRELIMKDISQLAWDYFSISGEFFSYFL